MVGDIDGHEIEDVGRVECIRWYMVACNLAKEVRAAFKQIYSLGPKFECHGRILQDIEDMLLQIRNQRIVEIDQMKELNKDDLSMSAQKHQMALSKNNGEATLQIILVYLAHAANHVQKIKDLITYV